MELRILRYFIAVANEKNITRVADILHVTQPTLSRQLKELEDELGTTLLIRGKRSLTLTNDGLLLKKYAEDIVGIANSAEQEFLGSKNAVSGVIAIGATEALGGCILAKYMKLFSDKYPGVQYELYNAMADSIVERLDSGLSDIGLLLEPVDTTKYEFLRFDRNEQWGILFNSEHEFFDRESVDVSEILDKPLMLSNRPNARNEILHWLGADESQLRVIIKYNLLSNVVLAVEEGLGIAVCINGALAINHSPELRFIPLSPERATRSVLVWRKNHLLNPAAALFVKMISEDYI